MTNVATRLITLILTLQRQPGQKAADLAEKLGVSIRTLHRYFDLTFAERRETNKRLFDSLDTAVRSGDVAAMQTVVAGIVQVAQTSPLADLGNLTGLIEAMDDPEAVFEL